MVSPQEKLNIILMRDSGESKRLRVRRSRFRALIAFFILCPFLAVGAAAGGYYLWQQNATLHRTIKDLEIEKQKLEHTAQRLSNLEALLNPEYAVKNALTENLAQNSVKNGNNANKKKDSGSQKTQINAETQSPLGQGNTANTAGGSLGDDPGHEVFPVLDTKEIIVQNVSSTLYGKKRLRTAFELRNAGTEAISGEVTCILILNTGESIRLTPKPADAGTYKISHFKSTALTVNFDKDYDLTNAQVILEIKNTAGTVIYRNIYPIAQ